MVFALAENSIQLVPDATLILHVLVVLVMVGVLNMTLFRPINRTLREREQETKGRFREAHKLLASVEEKLSRYERSLKDARAEGYHLLEQERAAALRERDKRLAALRDETKDLIARQKAQLEQHCDEVRRVLAAEAGRRAAQISTQILRRPV
jgi:F0F1-type ATP synthase membrane subunit b/b'